jgi:phosphoglycolate phosphatase
VSAAHHISAVIFDLDGTLLDTLADLADSMNTVLAAAGHPTHPQAAYRYFVGEGMETLVRRTLPETCRDAAEVSSRLGDMRNEYGQRWAATSRPYEGIPEMLTALDDRGLPLAVLSNKPDDFTRLTVGVPADRVLYVGDTATDMKTGTAAQMVTVGVTWGFRERDELEAHGAHRVIDEPMQLLALI